MLKSLGDARENQMQGFLQDTNPYSASQLDDDDEVRLCFMTFTKLLSKSGKLTYYVNLPTCFWVKNLTLPDFMKNLIEC